MTDSRPPDPSSAHAASQGADSSQSNQVMDATSLNGAEPPVSAESPCVKICQIDDQGLCRGCFRSLEEIGRWMMMSDEERLRTNQLCRQRRMNLGRA